MLPAKAMGGVQSCFVRGTPQPPDYQADQVGKVISLLPQNR